MCDKGHDDPKKGGRRRFVDISRPFYERLLFQCLSHERPGADCLKGSKNTAFVYTLNAREIRCGPLFAKCDKTMAQVFGTAEYRVAEQALPMNDYSKYLMGLFNEDARRARRARVFPQDRKKAFALGERMAAPLPRQKPRRRGSPAAFFSCGCGFFRLRS